MSQDLLFGEIDCYVFDIYFLENFSAHDPGGVKKVGEFQLRTVFFNAEVLMKPGRFNFFSLLFSISRAMPVAPGFKSSNLGYCVISSTSVLQLFFHFLSPMVDASGIEPLN
jgi:hypothetical protein